MVNQPMIGSRLSTRRRAPKAIDDYRVCSAASCETVLSRYNRKTTCYAHSPVKFPRVRGTDVRPEAG